MIFLRQHISEGDISYRQNSCSCNFTDPGEDLSKRSFLALNVQPSVNAGMKFIYFSVQ